MKQVNKSSFLCVVSDFTNMETVAAIVLAVCSKLIKLMLAPLYLADFLVTCFMYVIVFLSVFTFHY